jgi:uncharacterized membrane protein (TIGR02234 family)
VPRQAAHGRARREFALVLAAGAAGSGIVLLAAAQAWARAAFAPPPPLPASHVAVTGHELVPAATALGLAALGCLVALVATRGMARRAVGILLAIIGVIIAVAAATSVGHAHLAAAAAAHSLGPASSPRLEMAAFPWWAAAAVGGIVLAAAGVLAAWRGTRWPGMSGRYDRAPAQARGGDPAAAWDALDRGADPTVRGGQQ